MQVILFEGQMLLAFGAEAIGYTLITLCAELLRLHASAGKVSVCACQMAHALISQLKGCL